MLEHVFVKVQIAVNQVGYLKINHYLQIRGIKSSPHPQKG